MSNAGHSRSLARFGLAGGATAPKVSRSLSFSEILCWSGIVVGGLLILAGSVWEITAKPQDVWSEQQAEQYEAAAHAMHCLANDAAEHCPEGRPIVHDHQHERASEETIERFHQIEQELESALYQRDVLGIRVMQIGMLAIVGFGLALRASNNKPSS